MRLSLVIQEILAKSLRHILMGYSICMFMLSAICNSVWVDFLRT